MEYNGYLFSRDDMYHSVVTGRLEIRNSFLSIRKRNNANFIAIVNMKTETMQIIKSRTFREDVITFNEFREFYYHYQKNPNSFSWGGTVNIKNILNTPLAHFEEFYDNLVSLRKL